METVTGHTVQCRLNVSVLIECKHCAILVRPVLILLVFNLYFCKYADGYVRVSYLVLFHTFMILNVYGEATAIVKIHVE